MNSERELLEDLKDLFSRIHAEISLMREDFNREKETSFIREFQSIKTRNELFWQTFTHVVTFILGVLLMYALKQFGG